MDCPLLIVVSGPSGVGKDAVLTRMKQMNLPCHFTVTVTTRSMRVGERDGVDYYFIDRAEFQRMIDGNALLEWAEVYGNYYGVPKNQVRTALDQGLDVLIKPDVQGAATIRRLVPDVLLIFLAPPSMDELESRLRERMTESEQALKVRLGTARMEMDEQPNFDYVVVNHSGRIDETVERIQSIISRERSRSSRGRVVI